MSNQIAQVLIESSALGLDSRLFDYLLPEKFQAQAGLGARVVVPFQHQQAVGFICGFAETSEFENLKTIVKLIDVPPLITDIQYQLAKWISSYYFCNRTEVLRLCLPPGARLGKKGMPRISQKKIALCKWVSVDDELETAAAQRVKQLLLANPSGLIRSQIATTAEVSPSVITRLIGIGKIQVEETAVQRLPVGFNQLEIGETIHLNQQQELVCQQVNNSPAGSIFLLHGITGSGKTEVYFQLAEQAMAQGQQVLYLVPEISLTPQTLERARRRFQDQVALLHSNMSDGERFDQWFKIKRGEARFVLGARSALFAPFENLGLIIVDEEHETTYKQEENPRYHSREVVKKLTQLTQAKAVFGSATPSLESFHATETGAFHYLQLTKRYNQHPLPAVEIVDMRAELKQGNRSVLSQRLQTAIEECLKRQEQVIILLNRRGHSTFVICRDCGISLQCPSCEVSLTYHSQETILRCHYCDYRQKTPDVCPKCGSIRIRYFGNGTQKLEQELHDKFQTVRILRMDLDSTAQKGAHHRIFQQLTAGEVDILLGTQMIAKGLDLPKVGLVGVISADSTLNLPDFRGAERTFQLLTQVAGRTGRGDQPGRVIFQTYNPEHYALKFAKNHDYLGFYETEIANRRLLNYPPFSELLKFGLSGNDQEIVIAASQCLKELIEEDIKRILVSAAPGEFLELLGPAPALIEKIKNRYRHQILIKTNVPDWLSRIALMTIEQFPYRKFSKVRIIRDRQPYSVL